MTNVKSSSEIMTMTEDGNMFIALGSKTRPLLLLNIPDEGNKYGSQLQVKFRGRK